MTKLKIKNEFGKAEVELKEKGVTTDDVVALFHGAMVGLGYSNSNVLESMLRYSKEKLEDDNLLPQEDMLKEAATDLGMFPVQRDIDKKIEEAAKTQMICNSTGNKYI